MQQVTDSITLPAEHLALDEALLLAAESGECGETFRVWEIATPAVIIGRSTKVAFEVDQEFCKTNSIPILRRCSGGATIVAGAGCLMYSVIISLDQHPELRKIDAAHAYVISRVLRAAQQQLPETQLQGVCDLTWQNKKYSGNSLRVSRTYLLYHGTILYDADLSLLSRCLLNAPRQPEYRHQREHSEFVTNAPIRPAQFKADLIDCFDVDDESLTDLPTLRIQQLLADRYANPAWNFRH